MTRLVTEPIVHASHSPLVEVLKRADRFALREVPILILGESGTGKELVARRIHLNSKRSQGPFIPVNCGATPETLWESEWFGVQRGAFTGADENRAGLIASARGGTLFLDEIGEMPLPAQARLLRVLQEKSVRPLGSLKEIPVDFRLVAATHQPLTQLVEQGRFRRDLYYRIQVLELELPPLRTRRCDIPLLLRSFLKESWTPSQASRVLESLDPYLQAHPFQGNVREVKNCAERLLAAGPEANLEDWITACRFLNSPEKPEFLFQASEAGTKLGTVSKPIEDKVNRLEKQWNSLHEKPLAIHSRIPVSRISDTEIRAALYACGFHRRLASERLGITRRALQYRLAKWSKSENHLFPAPSQNAGYD